MLTFAALFLFSQRSVNSFFGTLFTVAMLSPAAAQDGYRTGVSGFFVPEKNSMHIGFVAFDFQRRCLSAKNLTLDLGLKFIGAATGKRGGYFAFGYFSEFAFCPEVKSRPVFQLAFLGGGGAAAPDHDGWMIQSALMWQHSFQNGIDIRAGINHSYVSEGFISGFSPVAGISWKLLAGFDSTGSGAFTWRSLYAEAGVAFFGDKRLGFIGTGASMEIGHQFSGDLMMHALTNVHGGYMQCIAAAGPHLDINRLRVSPALLLGIGGGGSVRTVGGGLYGIQAAVKYAGNRFFAAVKYQLAEAVSGRFGYNGLFVSAGKMLGARGTNALSWDVATKVYLGPPGFGNIGARFSAFEFRHVRLMGSTFWAFTHDHGAYAEGLFEASFKAKDQLPFYLITSVGAGAGSGVNQSIAALICSAGIGYALPAAFPFNIEFAHWRGGNIPPWSVGLSYRITGDQQR